MFDFQIVYDVYEGEEIPEYGNFLTGKFISDKEEGELGDYRIAWSGECREQGHLLLIDDCGHATFENIYEKFPHGFVISKMVRETYQVMYSYDRISYMLTETRFRNLDEFKQQHSEIDRVVDAKIVEDGTLRDY